MDYIIVSLVWAATVLYVVNEQRAARKQLLEIFIPPAPSAGKNEEGLFDVIHPDANSSIEREVKRRIDEEINLSSKPHFVRGDV